MVFGDDNHRVTIHGGELVVISDRVYLTVVYQGDVGKGMKVIICGVLLQPVRFVLTTWDAKEVLVYCGDSCNVPNAFDT